MDKNFISVVIPAHNEESVIAKAINSVLGSTYKRYEIIVVNDGSTDRTKKIVESLMRKHRKKIRLIDYENGHSPAFARNRGAEAAKGDILFFLDADDWTVKDTLNNTIKSFKNYKDIDFIIGRREAAIPKNWKRIFLYYWLINKKWIIDSDAELMTEAPCCPYVIKTRQFFKVGKFNESLYYNEDNEFRLRLNKMKIPKLTTRKIHTYSEMGHEKRDFLRRCKNTAKSSLINHSNLFKIMITFSISFFTFPLFYVMAFFYVFIKSKDMFVSIFAPILYFIRRFLDIYYIFKICLKLT